jgi:hypothetical protein
MTLTNFPDGVTSFGFPVLGGGGIPSMFGNVYFVDARNGNDGNVGTSKDEAFASLTKAYNTATSNNNDVIVIDGDSTLNEATMITWSKNRIHVVGLGGGYLTGQRTKIQLSTAGNLLAVAATINVTGTGNSFHNLKIMNSGTHASSLTALIDAGEANWYNNCSFMKFTDLDQTAVSDVEARGDSTAWTNCEFGFDTLVQSVARPTLHIKASGSTRMKHNRFIDCNFSCASSSADKAFILIATTSSLAFESTFKGCMFNAAVISSLSAITLDNAVDSVSGLVEGNLLFTDCATSTTNFCATVTDGIKTYGAVTSAQAFEAGAPA